MRDLFNLVPIQIHTVQKDAFDFYSILYRLPETYFLLASNSRDYWHRILSEMPDFVHGLCRYLTSKPYIVKVAVLSKEHRIFF